MNKYEGLFILNTGGKDDSAPDLIEALKKEIENCGATVKAIQKMERRPFARPMGKQTSGYYVNFVFEGDSNVIATLRPKLALNETVLRVQFAAVEEKAVKAEPAAA